ncbi:putative archaeal kinase related to aspartokinase, uridylate kinase [Archaeoglobus sulfaticallidus PM70-1]|uniref:Putative archaeal kinase related to aspartokinase, uridylate kinase n=1 Tax=Archaeoglobus sulfaticallidus PM70-1 TaxID=387631 RepID=N0BDT1_9EURY|nr:kinase related to aspartokinase uridylate kinase [Archaeoglobus sulfaticallidus]AGK60392.1 putative archaeal kinase related to aspartokinase, uridylate kinase [Archaeoglobus sulfaticallidus PM70-1]
MIVVKLGGSVKNNWKTLTDTLISVWRVKGESILIITGGGELADIVRKMNVDDENSHWMAIACMEINSYHLLSMSPELKKIAVKSVDEMSFEGVGVLLPYMLMISKDPLPHSWSVTSDSIAIWVAGELNAEKMIKITDVDGIYRDGILINEIRAEELNFKTCLDEYSPKLIGHYGIDVFICNGNKPERVKDYILRDKPFGTLIKGR